MPSECFIIKTSGRYAVVRATDITWVEAAGNYVVLHTAAGNHVFRSTVAALAAELDPKVFFRSSRSTIVNLTLISEIETTASGEFVLQLVNGERVPMTCSLRDLRRRLGRTLPES